MDFLFVKLTSFLDAEGFSAAGVRAEKRYVESGIFVRISSQFLVKFVGDNLKTETVVEEGLSAVADPAAQADPAAAEADPAAAVEAKLSPPRFPLMLFADPSMTFDRPPIKLEPELDSRPADENPLTGNPAIIENAGAQPAPHRCRR